MVERTFERDEAGVGTPGGHRGGTAFGSMAIGPAGGPTCRVVGPDERAPRSSSGTIRTVSFDTSHKDAESTVWGVWSPKTPRGASKISVPRVSRNAFSLCPPVGLSSVRANRLSEDEMAANLLVRHLKDAIENRFGGVVDLSDVGNASDSNREKQPSRCPRGLAALGLVRAVGADDAVAGAAVVDGSRDQGVVMVVGSTVYLVQAKWHGNGTSSIGQADVMKMVRGLRLITNEDWSEVQLEVPGTRAGAGGGSCRSRSSHRTRTCHKRIDQSKRRGRSDVGRTSTKRGKAARLSLFEGGGAYSCRWCRQCLGGDGVGGPCFRLGLECEIEEVDWAQRHVGLMDS